MQQRRFFAGVALIGAMVAVLAPASAGTEPRFGIFTVLLLGGLVGWFAPDGPRRLAHSCVKQDEDLARALRGAQDEPARHASKRARLVWRGWAYVRVYQAFLYFVLVLLALTLPLVISALIAIPVMGRVWRELKVIRGAIAEAREWSGLDSTVVVGASDAPELHAIVKAVASRLGVDMPDELRVGPGTEVFVCERFVDAREVATVLHIGLPVLCLLDRDQLGGVVAHELAHISNGDTHLSLRTAHLLATFQLLEERLLGQDGGESPLHPRMRKVAKRLGPLRFADGRVGELLADSASVRTFGADAVVDTLVQLTLTGLDHERAHSSFMAQHAPGSTEPPSGYVAHMTRELARQYEPMRARMVLARALNVPTDTDDVHPSLADRLAAAGAPFDLASPGVHERIDTLVQRAAQRAGTSPVMSLLPDGGDTLVVRVDAAWRDSAASGWDDFRFLWEDRLARTRAQQQEADRGVTTAWLKYEQARIASLQGDREESLELLRHAAHLGPEHPEIRYALGGALYIRGDQGCVDELWAAVGMDPASELAALPMLTAWYQLTGQQDDADMSRERAAARRAVLPAAVDEREQLANRLVDDLATAVSPRALDEFRARMLVDTLWNLGAVKRAYLGATECTNLPGEPVWVVSFEFDERAPDAARCEAIDGVLSWFGAWARGVERSVFMVPESTVGTKLREASGSQVFARIGDEDFRRIAA